MTSFNGTIYKSFKTLKEVQAYISFQGFDSK